MFKSIYYLLIGIATPAIAIDLPNAKSPNGYASIETVDGIRCKSGGSNAFMETGIYKDDTRNQTQQYNLDSDDIGAYARLVISLDATPKIDCNRLYDLELIRLQEEIKFLREQRDRLREQQRAEANAYVFE